MERLFTTHNLIVSIVLILVVSAIAGYTHYWKLGGHQAGFVTVDAIKIANAERAVASSLFNNGKNGGNQDAIVSLNEFGRKVTTEITKVADGRTVLVKQAVVASGLPDITDQVLHNLGLPDNAPTVDLSKQLEMAPTSSYQLMGAEMKRITDRNKVDSLKSLLAGQKEAAKNDLP